MCFTVFAQNPKNDTTLNELSPIEIKAHFNAQAFLGLTSAAKVITKRTIDAQSPASLLTAMNTTPGIRMEERSPGSYRLALRGSMIRSPFGVRNIKIYIDEIPFTDASGNTYLNLLDPVGVNNIQVLKGPDGSLFGPNSGGVIRINPNWINNGDPEKSLMLSTGSYGLFHQQLTFEHQVNENYSFSINQAFLRSDGYRTNSAMNKKYFQTSHRWKYNAKGNLKVLALYSDLGYETPGGLTLAQYEQDPQQDRPAGGPFPSASEQQAAIYNKTFLGGLINEFQITKNLKHVISLFGTNTNFKNPFITNYELRKESNLGFRTYLSYENNKYDNFNWEMQLGAEGQKGWYHVKNYENNYGKRGDLTDDDKLENGQHFYFYRVKARLYDKLIAEGSLGLNFNQIHYVRNTPDQDPASGKISLEDSWLPRLGLSYLITNKLALRGSISKGYSTPTIAEIRSSDNQINKDLQAEHGINYEMGIRVETKNRAVIVDLSTYQYNLKNGIIRQLNDAGNEFFVNAGKIDQKGVEGSIIAQLITPKAHSFIQGLIISSNLTLQDYTFSDYNFDDQDFSQNKVTSIPKWILVNTISAEFIKRFELNITHNFTSEIPLNDANSFYASKYHLIQAKVSWFSTIMKNHQIQLFLGVDNLLNQKYSLGNDINAMGNRFYNASSPRNFYTGLKFML